MPRSKPDAKPCPWCQLPRADGRSPGEHLCPAKPQRYFPLEVRRLVAPAARRRSGR